MEKLARNQLSLTPILTKMAEERESATDPLRAHLRNIELLLNRFITETDQGRAQSLSELRADLRLLTRTLANRLDEPRTNRLDEPRG